MLFNWEIEKVRYGYHVMLQHHGTAVEELILQGGKKQPMRLVNLIIS